MPSAGELLRSERIKRKRSVSEIANLTCISTRYLEAIEQDDTKTLPGDFFHRSFIRQYADALELDESDTRRILEALAPVPEPDPLPRLSVPQQIAQVEQSAKPLSKIPAGTAATLLVIVLVGCSGLYAIWHKAQENEEMQVTEAPASNPPQQQPQPAAREPQTQPSTPPTAAETQPPAIAPEPVTAAPPAPTATQTASDLSKINVDLAATETTWVSLSSQGKTVFKGIMDASQTRNFEVSEDAELLTGNAAGLDVRMNGRSLGPLGPRGQVRRVLFTQNDFQIVSPRRM